MTPSSGKTRQVLGGGEYRSVGLSGGVSNNRRLRQAIAEMAQGLDLPFFIARPEHTGDNAAMIAFAAYADLKAGEGERGLDVTFHPSRPLTSP